MDWLKVLRIFRYLIVSGTGIYSFGRWRNVGCSSLECCRTIFLSHKIFFYEFFFSQKDYQWYIQLGFFSCHTWSKFNTKILLDDLIVDLLMSHVSLFIVDCDLIHLKLFSSHEVNSWCFDDCAKKIFNDQ